MQRAQAGFKNMTTQVECTTPCCRTPPCALTHIRPSVRPSPLHASIHPCSPSISAHGLRGGGGDGGKTASLTVIVFVHVGSQERQDGPAVGVSGREDAWSRADSSIPTAIVSSFPPAPLDKPACALTDRWQSRSAVMLVSEAVSMEGDAV